MISPTTFQPGNSYRNRFLFLIISLLLYVSCAAQVADQEVDTKLDVTENETINTAADPSASLQEQQLLEQNKQLQRQITDGN